MVALSRFLGAVAVVFIGAQGARVARRRVAPNKFIEGVPVLNYDDAPGGQASLGTASSTKHEWIIVVKPGTSDSKIKSMCEKNMNGCNLIGHPIGGVPFIEMSGTEADLKAVLEESGGAAEFVEPDGVVHVIPDIEEGVGVQAATWGLNRIGADSRPNRGAGTVIYVQDTGVRYTHEEFGSRASSSLDMTTGEAVECNGDLSCALDGHGHGTHCSGTAAGTTYGVAPEALVGGLKTLSDEGSGQRSWQIAGIDWVTMNGVRPAILSMSLGGEGRGESYVVAIDAAVEAGVVVVVAGGNSNSDACTFSPAFVESAITVGSTTSSDARSSFSNFGSCTNIWAPGSAVLSAWAGSDTQTREISGTSMACPHVSGAAALILSADGTKKAPAVLQQLLDDAFLNVISDLRAGDTNALLCIAEGGAPPTPTPQPTPVPPPGNWFVTGGGCVEDGECVQSLNHPNNYGNNNYCSITLYGDVPIVVESFSTEGGYDLLTMGGATYSGTDGPPSGTYSGVITWNSDQNITSSGWQLCKGFAPTPQPTPVPPPGNWFVSGTGCVEAQEGRCVQSLNHPSNYSNNDACEITLYGDVPISVESFDTESGYDILTIADTEYSGDSVPPNAVYSGVITWTTDRSVSKSGWQLCKIPKGPYCPQNECRGSGWVPKDQSCGPGESKGCWNVDDEYQCCDNFCHNNECASGWVHHSVGCSTGQSIDCWNVDHLYHCCSTSG